jgi:hypothetical protein
MGNEAQPRRKVFHDANQYNSVLFGKSELCLSIVCHRDTAEAPIRVGRGYRKRTDLAKQACRPAKEQTG